MEQHVMLIHELTPNPNAVRIISNLDFRQGASTTFQESNDIPLVKALFNIEGIKEIYLLDNFITITKEESFKWNPLIDDIKKVLEHELPFHDPNFKYKYQKKTRVFPEAVQKEVDKINLILDKSIRPALQSDGGDLEIISLDGNLLTVMYEGACGSCPSATTVTLKAIEQMLKEEYEKDIQVAISNNI